jgi:5'-nucleotidase
VAAKKPRFLLSNDDGVNAPGLRVLAEALSKLGEVWTVAPLEEKSTTGHSLTLHKPLRVIPMGTRWFGVSGSPADCVNLGLRQLLPRKPDWVVSGPNRGANLGQDVFYSGTVSAAREATILGCPSLAVSLAVDFDRPGLDADKHYASAARMAVEVLKQLQRARIKPPIHTLLNLNVPDLPWKKLRGLKLARQGFRHYDGEILKRRDHRGKDYFWVGGQYKGYRRERTPEETDCHWVEEGYASLTPLKLDTTDGAFARQLTTSLGGAK